MSLTFGAWLKKRRRVLDLTQDDLAKRATCSVNSIRKIESDDLTPSKELALEIARALDVPSEMHADFVHFARTPNGMADENAFTLAPQNVPALEISVAEKTKVKFHPPAPLTTAIGRERDVNVVISTLRLPAARLVTLTGPPGTGKTRLALQVAAELESEFENGAAFVALAPLAQANLVERAIAEALDVRVSAQANIGVTLRSFLHDRELLLVLDNFEHLLDAGSLVSELLRAAPRLKILTTSREPLRVYGERELPISPLALPSLTPIPPWYELEEYASVQLFIERAQAVKPNFELEPVNAEAIARLCVGLDGLPLAIEMAAARVKWESPQQLLPHLSRRLESFRGGARSLEARQKTLRGAMDWSYERLDEIEQRVLSQLGVFRGGFTGEAAQAVCGMPIQNVLENLLEKSLVKQERDEHDATRYGLLEMIREYALEKLHASDQTEAVFERHWTYYTARAQKLGANMLKPETPEILAQLQREESNLRAALDWAVSARRAEHALELASALVPFWFHTSALNEGMAWLDQVLPMNVQVNAELAFTRARARDGYAEFLRMMGQTQRARELEEEAILDWRRAGEVGRPQLGFALLGMSRLALFQGQENLAHDTAQEALNIYIALQEPVGQARAFRRLAEWALNELDYDAAQEWINRALALAEAERNLFELGISHVQRGDITRAAGNFAQAEHDYKAAEGVNETAHEVFLELQVTRSLGVTAALTGDPKRGEMLLAAAGRLALTVNSRSILSEVLAGLALCAALQAQPAQAMRWLGVTDATLESVQIGLIVPEILEQEQTLELVKQEVAQEQLDKWYAEGRALTLEEALVMLPKGEDGSG